MQGEGKELSVYPNSDGKASEGFSHSCYQRKGLEVIKLMCRNLQEGDKT